MHFRQFYLGCLAHASYLIGSEEEAVVVDPQRDVDIYLEEAKAYGFTIKHVIETHCHADFVSGHTELVARTGAKVYFGAKATPKFDFVGVRDGDELTFGKVRLRFIETPGHTPESISILIFNREKSETIPESVLTGDTMFIGDVGRPDLLGSRMAPAELAGMLYDSLHNKLLTLPDQVKVYPAHGAGSMCGRNISSETSSTIGDQRRFNYALQPMKRDDFIKMMTTDLPEAPSYFGMDAQINLEGPHLLQELPAPKALFPAEVQRLHKEGHLVLDTRPAAQYGAGHIPGSLNISLSGQFASWAGTVIKPTVPIILVAEDEQRVREAQIRLARVGLENVTGYLYGGIYVWNQSKLPLRATEQISVEELQHRLDEKSVDIVLDVRRSPEWTAGHIAQAQHHPLNHLAESAVSLPRNARVAVVCAGGYRSSIATSVLEQMGFERLTNIVGGMTAWNNAKLSTAC
ncbi:MAG: MBL fold metallo-hydrolase [Acidobacteria bacterium]|nr:MBL fold metallo-hydrolase [Acidobacteriota bacterium]